MSNCNPHIRTDIPSQQLSIDLLPSDESKLSGFRLKRLELFNWGTFNGHVWTLNVDGKNSLVTGDIGSGKSTLVDAITTLLVPSQRVAYNKAAGAGIKERTLQSYVLGFYKSERNESTGTSRPIGLRDSNSYSVILGVFHNAGYDQTVTLAQVFWINESQSTPDRFFVTAEKDLSIAGNFSNFGSDISGLRKKLRANGAEIHSTFPPYGAWFRRFFGIKDEQAMELFHQTVSMKSVGNLTDFVRTHMLESFDVSSRISALIDHFDNLNSAHDAVLRAANQINLLTPIVADCQRHDEVKVQQEQRRLCREALKPYFSQIKLDLLKSRIANLSEDWMRQKAQIARIDDDLRQAREEESDLKRCIAENGGDRIESLSIQIKQKEVERDARKQKASRYNDILSVLGIHPATDSDAFIDQARVIRELSNSLSAREAELQNKVTETSVEFQKKKEEHTLISAEIQSLKSRRSNIPLAQLSMRDQLCSALKVSSDKMPFAGELLQVHEDEKDWEGAAERLCHNFALSILVPDKNYAEVANWVDGTNLKGRLVYFRVRNARRQEDFDVSRQLLANKLSIKSDSEFFEWLEGEINHRFRHVCCDTQEQFRRESRAVTRAGQVKSPDDKHEKDDRHRIDDRSRYVLGWTNKAKIEALEGSLKNLERLIGDLGAKLSEFQIERTQITEKLHAISKLEEYESFFEVDWRSIVAEITRLEAEKRHLETASDVLKNLNEKLRATVARIGELNAERDLKSDKCSKTEQKKLDAETLAFQTQESLQLCDLEKQQEHFDSLKTLQSTVIGDIQLTIESCESREREMREYLQNQIDAEQKKVERLQEKIVAAMTKFRQEFPIETQEFDANVDAAGEYAKLLGDLQSDDLPRFQARFKQLLNENTIREVANFQSQLMACRESIKERIAKINASLRKIKYNEGRYIVLEAIPTLDVEIRDFQIELRTCTEDTFTGSEDQQYSEAKFLQVKAIIERFRGREGQTDLDKRWTSRVTDVRNWFSFAASERWKEDDSEHEHYSDSGGKSGGQKEKLAYTILAASLAYQFGLELGEAKSRTFRFVVIDEAFGRGSDDSAQYGLQLFEQLDLQLLVVTPLQKIHIIEPYVSNVGFVHNDGGNASKLRNLTIEQYHAEKERSGNWAGRDPQK